MIAIVIKKKKKVIIAIKQKPNNMKQKKVTQYNDISLKHHPNYGIP